MENFFKSLLSVFFVFFLCPLVLFSQGKEIKGIVISSDSIPLICAEVSAKGSNQAVLTDSMGNFTLVVKPKDKIKIMAEGFVSKDFKSDKLENDSIFVLDYDSNNPGRTNRIIYDGNTQNIVYLDGKKIDVTGYNNIYEVLQGKATGVLISGGEDDMTIIIRGVSTVSGDTDPLVVIDGVRLNIDALNNLALQDIMSIDILKDASTSRYGSRGGNGVVEVRTKRR